MRKLSKKHDYSWVLKFLGYAIVVLIFISVLVFLEIYLGRNWDQHTRFTTISHKIPITVRSFDPNSKTGVVLVLPDNLEIESVSGRGKWLAGKIHQAGKPTWVGDSVADYLGISYVGIDSNLSIWDKIMWEKYSRQISWKEIDLGNTNYLETVITPDNLQITRLADGWDSKARDWFFDQSIAEMSLGVAIVNTSPIPGLGIHAGRVVESVGFKVRDLTNSTEEIDKCLVKSLPELQKSQSVQKLIHTFDCNWQRSEETDLSLILGKQYREWLLGK
jgi:hypothetical protein